LRSSQKEENSLKFPFLKNDFSSLHGNILGSGWSKEEETDVNASVLVVGKTAHHLTFFLKVGFILFVDVLDDALTAAVTA
jgi:hypothetical protein